VREPNFDCMDCGVDTIECDYFMIHDWLWEQVAGDREDKMLCIECTSIRLGRSLREEDFTDCELNYSKGFKSPKRVTTISKVTV